MTDLDITADPNASVFWSAKDLEHWRAQASEGATIVYYAGPSSLMRERTRDVALDQTASVAWHLYTQGRAVLTFFQRSDGIGEYRLTAAELDEPRRKLDRAPASHSAPGRQAPAACG